MTPATASYGNDKNFAGQLARAFLLIVMAALVGCSAPIRSNAHLKRFEYSMPQMGVPFRIVLYASDEPAADSAAESAFKRIEQLNSVLSDYDPDSELSRLSHTWNEPVRVSDDLWKVLVASQSMAESSDGAFDITVGPMVNLWRRARRQKQLPPTDQLEEARFRVGHQYLKLDPATQTARLLRPEMRLDLGGIAKGYAVDEALKRLREAGFPRAMVAASGDIGVGDPPPGRKAWRIEIGGLDATNAPAPKFVLLKNAAVTTSGDLFQRLEINGKRYSHIVDPRTGLGLTDHSMVSVVGRNCMEADSLATAVSVLGPQRGLDLIRRYRGSAAYILRQPETEIEAVKSPRLKKFLERPEVQKQ